MILYNDGSYTIHNDLHMHNIMVDIYSKHHECYLIDFGVLYNGFENEYTLNHRGGSFSFITYNMNPITWHFLYSYEKRMQFCKLVNSGIRLNGRSNNNLNINNININMNGTKKSSHNDDGYGKSTICKENNLAIFRYYAKNAQRYKIQCVIVDTFDKILKFYFEKWHPKMVKYSKLLSKNLYSVKRKVSLYNKDDENHQLILENDFVNIWCCRQKQLILFIDLLNHYQFLNIEQFEQLKHIFEQM